MTNPRFDCFKWNSICQTTSAAVRQTKTALKAVLTADSQKSAVVRQPSPRAARRPPECASECPRAVYAARGSGAHTREGDRQRLVTDGGTEPESERVTVRVDDPEIVAALNDAENKSEATRQALREAYAAESDTDRSGDVPPKAAEAYDWLIDYCGVGGRIGIETARSLIAQKFQIKTDAVDNLVIRPLNNNDWIGVNQGIQSVSIVVKPKPVDETAPMEGGEPADD